MDESAQPKPPEPEQQTPEVAQMLKMLEIQTAAHRAQRPAASSIFQGMAFKYGSLVIIVVFVLAAVIGMEWFVSQLPKPHHADGADAAGSVAADGAKSGNSPGNGQGKP